MPKKEKKDVPFVLGCLEKLLQNGLLEKSIKNHSNVSISDSVKGVKKNLERSLQVASDQKFTSNLYVYSDGIIETCKISMAETGSINNVLMVNMLLIMLSKMEDDGLIKINI